MKGIQSCFILKDGQYIEVPVEEVMENGAYKEPFAGRYFYPFGSRLLEMSREDRKFFYACQESMAHIVKPPKKWVKADKLIRIVSLEDLMERMGDGNMRLDFLCSQEVGPEDETERRLMNEAVRVYREKLSPEEDQLLTEYYDKGNSDETIAQRCHVSQSTITRQRRKILGKLLNFLKEE